MANSGSEIKGGQTGRDPEIPWDKGDTRQDQRRGRISGSRILAGVAAGFLGLGVIGYEVKDNVIDPGNRAEFDHRWSRGEVPIPSTRVDLPPEEGRYGGIPTHIDRLPEGIPYTARPDALDYPAAMLSDRVYVDPQIGTSPRVISSGDLPWTVFTSYRTCVDPRKDDNGGFGIPEILENVPPKTTALHIATTDPNPSEIYISIGRRISRNGQLSTDADRLCADSDPWEHNKPRRPFELVVWAETADGKGVPNRHDTGRVIVPTRSSR